MLFCFCYKTWHKILNCGQGTEIASINLETRSDFVRLTEMPSGG